VKKSFAFVCAALFVLLTFMPMANGAPVGENSSRAASTEHRHRKPTKHKTRKKHKKPKTTKVKTSATHQKPRSRYEFPRQRQAE
jgi:hypothetical protein